MKLHALLRHPGSRAQLLARFEKLVWCRIAVCRNRASEVQDLGHRCTVPPFFHRQRTAYVQGVRKGGIFERVVGAIPVGLYSVHFAEPHVGCRWSIRVWEEDQCVFFRWFRVSRRATTGEDDSRSAPALSSCPYRDFKISHPLDVINEHILSKNFEAQIAITHDSVLDVLQQYGAAHVAQGEPLDTLARLQYFSAVYEAY